MKTTHDSTVQMTKDSKLFTKPQAFSNKVKKEQKFQLLQELGLRKQANKLLIGFRLDKNDSNNKYLFEEIVPGLEQLAVNVVVIGKKPEQIRESKNIKYLSASNNNTKLVQAGVDLMISPREEEFEDACLANGTPCVFFNSKVYNGNILDFNPLEETGNGFLCDKENSWILFSTIVKVIETYKFKYDWKTLCKNAFETGQGL
jgi:glycogen synthase